MYDSDFYGELQRKEFEGRSIGTSGGVTLVGRWYPKGPIKIVKFGVTYSVAVSGSELTISLKKGASASVVATIVASTTTAQWARASKASLTQTVGKGSYISITTDGTADTGSVQAFIDYYQLYDANHEAPGVA
jgi:hypothetical protein